MKKNNDTKKIATGILGNIFEHYDTALYALLAPFISPVFFSSYSKIDGLILSYAILCLGLIFRPIGALLFGYIADKRGKRKALSITLCGSSTVCLLFALVPSYAKIGFAAPLAVALIKAMQGFFSAGATPAGAIYILELSPKKSLMSSIYDASSIAGIFIASLGVFILSYFNVIDSLWRILFVLGSFSAFIGYVIRKYPESSAATLQENEHSKITDIFKIIKSNFLSFMSILVISGFSSSIYYFSLIFLNGYLPLISNISNPSSMKINTFVLLLDFCTLPLIGFLADKCSKEKIMGISTFFITLFTIPLFSLLEHATVITSTLVRIAFVIMGVLFSAPLHHLALELAPSKHRLKIIALAYALGSQLIGLPSCAIGLWLYKKTHLVYAPGIYLTAYGIISMAIILRYYLSSFKAKNLVKT